MPAPSPSWNLVRVYGTWRGLDGSLRAGTYKVTIPTRITNSTDDVIIPAGIFAEGSLQTSVTNAPSLDVQVPATDDPDNLETGWKVRIEVKFADGAATENYQIDVPYASAGVNLRTIVLSPNPTVQAAQLKVGLAGGLARLDANGDVVNAAGVKVTGGASSWSTLPGKPTTFTPAIHSHPSTQISDSTPLGRSLLAAPDAVTARGIIGAGTGSGTGTGSVASTDITDSTATGRSVLTAASAAAARTLLGAGTSSLALGTTSTTAKSGDYVPAWSEVTGKPSTFPPSTHTHPATDITGLTKTSVGLGNVDNTSDLAKPVSTAQQAALDGKANTEDVPTTLSTLGGTLTIGQVAPRAVVAAYWNGTAWTSSPAAGRTDITVMWIDPIGTSTTPPFVAGRIDTYVKATA